MIKDLCSICCLSYNHADYIQYSIESFFNQSYKNIEIIALDDGSSDNSVDILNNMSNNSPVPFTVLSQNNTGNIGANFNNLFKKSQGEYVIFIALDDALTPDFLKEQIDIMNSDSNILMSGTTAPIIIDENNNIQSNKSFINEFEKSNSIITPEILLELEYNKAHSVFIQGCLFKRELIDRIGGFDEDILGDDIVLRTKIFNYLISNPNYSLHIKRKSGFYYRRHSSNVSRNLSRFLLLLAQYYDRYWNDKPVSSVFKKYFIEYIGSSSENDTISLIKSHSYFIKVLLETPDASILYSSKISNSKNKGNYNYYTYSIPFFSIKKYKNFITGKKYKIISIFGINITL